MRDMDTRMTKEALLRHLLDAEVCVPDEKMIYSYLLGYRLFQSPEQLLKEIQRRICNKEPAEVKQRFQRHNNPASSRSNGPVCTKCRLKHEAPRQMSKSTNNMLDKETSSMYVELIRNNVMVKETGRNNIPNKSSSPEDLSPALSANEISGNTTAKSSDFDDYCEIDGVFENRRNTAPPNALDSLVTPQNLKSQSQTHISAMRSMVGTDFGTKPKTPDANANASLDNLPETNLDDLLCADGVVASGEDTIRRRKKGRRRTTVTSPDNELFTAPVVASEPATETEKLTPKNVVTDRRSTASRDSGILSGVIESEVDDDLQTNSNNNNKKNKSESKKKSSKQSSSTPPSAMRNTSALYRNLSISVTHSSSQEHEHSGYASQISPATANETLDSVSKDIEAHVCAHLNEENVTDTLARQLHLLHVLLVWVRDFPSDFRKNKTRVTLEGVIQSFENESKELKEHCAHVLDTLAQCRTAQKKYEDKLIDSDHQDALKRSEDARKTKENMIAMVTGMSDVADARKLAEQLCLIEMDLLSHLGAEEFLQMFTSRGDDESRTNLGACVRWFNHLSHLVATTVCMCRKPKHRRHVITLFAQSASRCYGLSNFNSAMAILTGLSLGAVARLKRTWNKVDTEEIEKLQSIFDPSNNFRRYRTMFNSRWAALRNQQEVVEIKVPTNAENRYSSASQHSVTSRMSVASMASQYRDSGIECENESSTSKPTSASSSPKRRFAFDDVTSLTGIQDGVLVPFLTLMVKDVYFLNHSTPTIEQDGTINFEKLRHLGEILHPLETWKNNPCVYQKNDQLQDFLLHSPVLKDSELYSLSYKREPPKNKFEKTQLKTIRSEIETGKKSNSLRRIISRRKTM